MSAAGLALVVLGSGCATRVVVDQARPDAVTGIELTIVDETPRVATLRWRTVRLTGAHWLPHPGPPQRGVWSIDHPFAGDHPNPTPTSAVQGAGSSELPRTTCQRVFFYTANGLPLRVPHSRPHVLSSETSPSIEEGIRWPSGARLGCAVVLVYAKPPSAEAYAVHAFTRDGRAGRLETPAPGHPEWYLLLPVSVAFDLATSPLQLVLYVLSAFGPPSS